MLAWHRVAEGNCVAERWGGGQPEANLSSQSSQTRRLNPIRLLGVASLRRKGEALALSLPEAITKHDHTIAKDSEGGWDEKAGKAEQLSVEILLGATGIPSIKINSLAGKSGATNRPSHWLPSVS